MYRRQPSNNFKYIIVSALLVFSCLLLVAINSERILAQNRKMPSEEWFEKQCKRLTEKMADLEIKCQEECDLRRKRNLINQMWRVQQKIDVIGGDCPVSNIIGFCGGILDDNGSPIEVFPYSLNLAIDETASLIVTLNGTCKDGDQEGELTGRIGWLSLDPDIASIDQDGLVTGKSEGVTSVYAVSLDIADLSSNTVQVGVECDATVAYIEVIPAFVSIAEGESLQLNGSIIGPECVQGDISWLSTNSTVASVSSDGTVLGESVGVATIKAEVGNTGVVGFAEVEVGCDTTDANVDVTPQSAKILIGDSVQLSATIVPDCLPDDISWSSSNPEVASVSSAGLVTGHSEGNAFIFADVEGTPQGWWGSTVRVISSWCDQDNDGMLDQGAGFAFGCCGYEIINLENVCIPVQLSGEHQSWGYIQCPVGDPCDAGGGCGDLYFQAQCCSETGECRECTHPRGGFIPGPTGSCPQFYNW